MRRMLEIFLYAMVQYASVKIYLSSPLVLATPVYGVAFALLLLRGPQLFIAYFLGSLLALFPIIHNLNQGLAFAALLSLMPLCFYLMVRRTVGTVLPLISAKSFIQLGMMFLFFSALITFFEAEIFNKTLLPLNYSQHLLSLFLYSKIMSLKAV